MGLNSVLLIEEIDGTDLACHMQPQALDLAINSTRDAEYSITRKTVEQDADGDGRLHAGAATW